MSGTSFTSESSDPTYTTQITENKTYIPDVDYKVTFDLDGGTGVSNTTYRAGVGLTLGTPTKSGQFEFLGWTGEGITTPTKNVTIPANAVGDKSYKANWQEYYIVKWDAALCAPSLGFYYDGGYYSRNVGYIGESSLVSYPYDTTDKSKASHGTNSGAKRIRYTDQKGSTKYANPFNPCGSGIKIIKGSAFILEMYAGTWGADSSIAICDPSNSVINSASDSSGVLLSSSFVPTSNIKIKLRYDNMTSQNTYHWYCNYE